MSLLFLFLLAGVGARAGRPGRRKPRRIATSDEVRIERERAEHELRARAEEIGRTSPWGPAVRTRLVDTCARGGGRNHLARLPEPRSARRAVFGTCVSDPSDVTLAALRERPGTLFAWTLSTMYHTVPGA
ncbi:hypothetical protein AQF52_6034 [Streptomyces venezuelae]|uniref:hypothetical protein n=1 Tax=Streptomyces gardneri TaxID=66892 RepID=UPI0006BD8988|nr:hypothetical protein [Streptomyces gardneri]ALO11627.1 hypothetical protein AQF52_6034 [Streptomyces venezuelae]QPK48518.1 hypothetical protein H4W23_30325 [Streptomyces gardneri]WRK39990.1 hypothetical protein U0M97_30465 [Streptomyces venezuelae]CUM37830.1 hypothetical protein BN2537_4625 [Streptomyces venezuelae]